MISIEAVLSLDITGRARRIAMLHPDFPECLAQHFRAIWNESTGYGRKAHNRAEDFRDVGNDPLRQAEFLGWEVEIFEAAFQEAVGELLAKTLIGVLDTTAWNSLRQHVLPESDLALSVEMGRVPRPQIPTPRQSNDGVQSIEPLGGGGPYGDWFRLASWEREVYAPESAPGKPLLSRIAIWAYCRIQEGRPREEQIALMPPNAIADLTTLHSPALATRLQAAISFAWWNEGLLGSAFILLPGPRTVKLCHLISDPLPGPIIFRDPSGSEQVLFRSWRSAPLYVGKDVSTYALEGCDLIAHPKVLRILQMSDANLRVFTKVIESQHESATPPVTDASE